MNNDIRKLIEDNWDDIKELIVQKAEAEQKPKTIWDLDAVNGEEEYYYITEDGEIETTYFNSLYDEKVRNLGNAFLTKVEAVVELERREIEAVIRKYSRPFKLNEGNYVIKHNVTFKMVEIGLFGTTDYGIPYFESKEIAQNVIDDIGEERLIEYWFDVAE